MRAVWLVIAACGSAPPEVITHHANVKADACLHGDHDYVLTRVHGDAALCSPTECYAIIDGAGLAPRPLDPIVAASREYEGTCARGLCWATAPTKVRIAFNPDGKRAALIDDKWDVSIYDVASSRVVAKFHADIPGEFWFIGDTVYIASAPAGPGSNLMAYSLDGKYQFLEGGMYHGEVALSDPHTLVFEDNGLRSLMFLDGVHPPRPGPRRTVPAGPCEAYETGDEWTDADGPCGAYLSSNYVPYDRSYVIADGDRYLGFIGYQLFTLDATLAERSRITLPICKGTERKPAPPDGT